MSQRAQELYALLVGDTPNWLSHKTDLKVGGVATAIARNPEGRPTLLVPATGRAKGVRIATKGLTARIGALADGSKFQDWLMVTCLAPGLDSTFFLLCDDVLARIEGLGDEDDPVAETLRVVERWQELMTAASSPQMSAEKCTGLIAELHVMEALVDRIGAGPAFASWAGPDNARIDFRFADVGIEVKGTRNRDRFKVTIHGLLQLDESEVGDLYLFAQQLEEVPSGGDSIPEALDRLVAAGVPQVDLRTALARIGYSADYADVYKEIRFKVLDERGVHVTEATPRITASSFVAQGTAEAVSAVSYVLDLTDLAGSQGRLAKASDVFEGVVP